MADESPSHSADDTTNPHTYSAEIISSEGATSRAYSAEIASLEAALREHVKSQLAPYKAPKRILISKVPLRAPNGKADYKSVTDFASAAVGNVSGAEH